MNYRNLSQLNDDIRVWASTLRLDLDLVVGIPRSGLLASLIFALHRNLQVTDIDGLIEGRLIDTGKRAKRRLTSDDLLQGQLKILVLDDSVYSGASMREAKEQLAPLEAQHDIVYASIYVRPGATDEVDYYCEIVQAPRIFEWNIMHSWVLESAGVDLDTVLFGVSHDPTLRHLEDAPAPLYRPTRRIAKLVTYRPERERAYVEAWLEAHEIAYDELIMTEHSDITDPDIAYQYAEEKVAIYSSDPALELFLEGSERQAKRISSLTGKPVLCTSSDEMFHPSLLPWSGPTRNTPDHSVFDNESTLQDYEQLVRQFSAQLRRIAFRYRPFRMFVEHAV